MFKDREAFLTGARHYVPGMQFASELVHGQPTAFSLGTPAAVSATALDTDIDADGAPGLVTTQSWTADSPYGRTLTMSMDADPGAAGGVYDVYGWDYLGQRMIERFTHVNGSTAVQYGKKAFYTVDKVVNVTAATNATTVNLGTGWQLGLPYKGDVSWAKENGVLVPLYKRDTEVWYDMAAASVVTGSSLIRRAPFPGYVSTLYAAPSGGGSTTNAATTVEIATVAVTGLTVTADQDTQTLVSDTPTTAGYNANNRFRPGDLIEIVHAATTGGGSTSFGLVLTPTQFVLPVLTDPQTAILGDPRGTYEALTTYDGAKEIIVGLTGDPAINSNNRGGLHGIAHYAG